MRNFSVLFMLLFLIVACGVTASADELTMKEGANISLSATTGPNATLTISSTATDENVKVSSDDTTAGFLNGKLVGGAGITLTEGNGGGNETLTIAAPETLTTKGDVLYHNGSGETRLPVGASGQYLTSDANDNLLWANPPEGDQLFNSNVLLNAYRTGENLDLTVSKMIDGVVDAFTDSNGVDATASTNEDFDSTGDYYEPTRTGATTIPAVAFDGVNDYLFINDATLGQSDGKSFLISFWIKMDDNGVTEDIYFTSTSKFFAKRDFTNKLEIKFRDSNGSDAYAGLSNNATFTIAGGLHHVLIAADFANSVIQVYIDDVEDTMTDITAVNNRTVKFKDSSFAIGAQTSGVGKLNGQLAHFYLAEEYLDISILSNRRKFIDAIGNPVDLGSNGSTPTGNQPLIYLNNTTSTWQNNLGSGGNFTENGALTDGTDLSTSGTADNMTLVSNSQSAKAEPNGANILLMAEDVAADITLNTDLKASVSRDGGTTFTQVTLSEAGEFEKGNLLTGTVDLSGQPTGTDMEWKVETLNNKFLNLHGVGLEWR
ncbi:MAG: LamG domain-containing protein [Nitrospinae bacterium]|nr:LamG domain-containing protein [Nitrospinota bacterium]